MTTDNWLNDAVQARRGIRVSFGAEMDNAAMNRALRAAAGRLEPEEGDAEPDDVPPAAQGSADGGPRVPPSTEQTASDRMNALIRRRRITGPDGTVVYYDPVTGRAI